MQTVQLLFLDYPEQPPRKRQVSFSNRRRERAPGPAASILGETLDILPIGMLAMTNDRFPHLCRKLIGSTGCHFHKTQDHRAR